MSEISPLTAAAAKAHAWARDYYHRAYESDASESDITDARFFCMYAQIALHEFILEPVDGSIRPVLSEDEMNEYAIAKGIDGVLAEQQKAAQKDLQAA